MTAAGDIRSARVIVFDLDDTLYLERDYVRSGFLAVEAASRISGFAAQAWSLFVEGARHTTFDLTLERLGKAPSEPALVPQLVAIYREHVPDISLPADTVKAIEACEQAGTRPSDNQRRAGFEPECEGSCPRALATISTR